jgi:two-component system response regulator FixJ
MTADRPPVHVIDDFEPMRTALAHFLTAAGFAPRTYASAELFLETPEDATQGCVVTDLRLPGMSGLDLLRRLGSAGRLQPVILMSGHADVSLAVEIMKSGAADFLHKPFRAAALVAAVRASDTTRAPELPPAPNAAEYRRLLAGLSPRQHDVLAGVMAGKLNKTIAHELGIGVRTVEGYRAELMAKMRARRVGDLVRIGVLASF